MERTEVQISPRLPQRTILRRYMDLAKLLDLLHTKSLYLRRADGFADRLEGALFPSFRKSLDAAHAEGKFEYDSDYFYRRARVGNYVSCWTRGAADNMAMWQLYGGAKTSVAITTTVERLIHTGIKWRRPTLIQNVQYVDHRKVKTYVMGRYTDVLQYKNDAYQYEDEIRVVVPAQDDNWEQNPMGIRLPIPTLNDLVRSVVVGPEADPNYKDSVQDLCRKYGLTAPVRNSILAVMPK